MRANLSAQSEIVQNYLKLSTVALKLNWAASVGVQKN